MFKFASKVVANSCRIFRKFTELDQTVQSLQKRTIQIFSVAKLDNKIAQNYTNVLNEISDTGNIFKTIENSLLNEQKERLFAVIQLCGKQFKITDGDIVIVQGYWPPTIGDKIRLDKVLLAGSHVFTLVGRPILESGVCDVQATIIEKTLSHTKTHFRKKRRKQYQRINFHRTPHTMIRINSININPNFNSNQNGISLNLF